MVTPSGGAPLRLSDTRHEHNRLAVQRSSPHTVRLVSSQVFSIAVFVQVALVVSAAAILRGRFFATFTGVLLTLQGLIAVALYPTFVFAWPIYAYLQLCVGLHFVSLSRARMRPLWWRALISVPALFFAGGTMLGFPLAILAAFGVSSIWAAWIPFAIAAFGVIQSLFTREEEIDVTLDGEIVPHVRRHPRGTSSRESEEVTPLRVVQITDPHLGPLMSVARLRRICERAVERDPDLVLLTGDFLTMESQADPSLLDDSLAPLATVAHKTFACMGNHDHEAPHVVRRALARHGITLLVDESTTLETRAGVVQVLGVDYAFRDRRAHLEAVCERHPRLPGHLRVVLLHDPGAFKHLPHGHGDIVFSGHTHGGQLGLLSVGLAWTFVSLFTSIPDHGFWARGQDRLYVHRGTGVYGFPLRVGVPSEQSLVRVHVARELP
jgi:predicted MPP superfamily phosphohydrolase